MARPKRHVWYDGWILGKWFVPRLNDWVTEPSDSDSYRNTCSITTFKMAKRAMLRYPDEMIVEKSVRRNGRRYIVSTWTPIK